MAVEISTQKFRSAVPRRVIWRARYMRWKLLRGMSPGGRALYLQIERELDQLLEPYESYRYRTDPPPWGRGLPE